MSFDFRDDSFLHYGLVRYYWVCIKHFGMQVWRSGRAEVFSSLGVLVIVFLISWRLRDATALSAFEIAVVANLSWLALFALWHLLRSPWLIHRDPEIRNSAIKSHRAWGIFGLAVLIIMVAGAVTGCVWFYTTGLTRMLAVRYEAPSTKDAEIMQLRQKLDESEKHPSKSPSFSLRQQQSGKNNVQTGPITQAPCSVAQFGGEGNQTTTNCGTVRSLTPQEKTEFVENLKKGPPGTATVWAVETGQNLGIEIYDALKAAGWQMQEPGVQMMLILQPMREDIDVFVHGEPGDTAQFSTSDPTTVTLIHSLAVLRRFKSGGLGRSENVAKGVTKISVGPPLPN